MTDDPLSLLSAGASDPGEEAVEGSLRPRTLGEYIGQDHILGPGRLLRRSIEADRLTLDEHPLDLRQVVVVQAAGLPLGKGLRLALPERCVGLLQVEPRANAATHDAFDAPFPDRGHRAALRAFEGLVAPTDPISPEDGALAAARALGQFS